MQGFNITIEEEELQYVIEKPCIHLLWSKIPFFPSKIKSMSSLMKSADKRSAQPCNSLISQELVGLPRINFNNINELSLFLDISNSKLPKQFVEWFFDLDKLTLTITLNSNEFVRSHDFRDNTTTELPTTSSTKILNLVLKMLIHKWKERNEE